MDLFRAAERLMAMDDAAWARHANPWSAWTRFTCLPLLVIAVWSRDWIGWWALIPVACASAWTWWNPRAFPPPRTTDAWASKGTFGERIFLNRKTIAIPAHHERAARVLTGLAGLGGVVLIYGVIVLDVWATGAGLAATIAFKAWYVDRMVWLYEDMKDADPAYVAWRRPTVQAPDGTSNPR